MKYEIDIDGVPEGWKVVAIRRPLCGEKYLNPHNKVIEAGRNVNLPPRVIVESMKIYREPSLPADYGRLAEFSDDGVRWVTGTIEGWARINDADEFPWITCDGDMYKHCRIDVVEDDC